MTLDDKKKCSEIWLMVSGDFIPPGEWNGAAGDELARFIASVYKCSGAMTYVPKPSGSAPGWGWLVNYVYNVLKNRYNMNRSLIFSGCETTAVGRYRSSIPAACLPAR